MQHADVNNIKLVKMEYDKEKCSPKLAPELVPYYDIHVLYHSSVLQLKEYNQLNVIAICSSSIIHALKNSVTSSLANTAAKCQG